MLEIMDNETKIVSLVIYKDNNESAARTIWLSIKNNFLFMEQQDYSPQLEDFFGKDTIERFISKVPVEYIMRILKVEDTNQLLYELKQLFGKNSGLDEFQSFLDSHHIPYEFGTY